MKEEVVQEKECHTPHNYVLYILMRTDLPSMKVGRAAAQASHATSYFHKKVGHWKEVKNWALDTDQGFGTAIVLGVTLKELTRIVGAAQVSKFPAELIIDPDYRFIADAEIEALVDMSKVNSVEEHEDPSKIVISKKEVTCGFIFGDKVQLSALLGDLPLYA